MFRGVLEKKTGGVRCGDQRTETGLCGERAEREGSKGRAFPSQYQRGSGSSKHAERNQTERAFSGPPLNSYGQPPPVTDDHFSPWLDPFTCCYRGLSSLCSFLLGFSFPSWTLLIRCPNHLSKLRVPLAPTPAELSGSRDPLGSWHADSFHISVPCKTPRAFLGTTLY